MTFPEHHDGPADYSLALRGDFRLITQVGDVGSTMFNPPDFNTCSVIMKNVGDVIDVSSVDNSGEAGK
jgi:hypothetical protein